MLNRPEVVDPSTALLAGAQELAAVLTPCGFAFALISQGQGSGGPFAVGAFRRDSRQLELHFRSSLGLVSYQVGEWKLSHPDYVRAVRELHGGGRASYPGFTSGPIAAFIDLRKDLEEFGEVFLTGEDRGFMDLTEWVSTHPLPRGVNAS